MSSTLHSTPSSQLQNPSTPPHPGKRNHQELEFGYGMSDLVFAFQNPRAYRISVFPSARLSLCPSHASRHVVSPISVPSPTSDLGLSVATPTLVSTHSNEYGYKVHPPMCSGSRSIFAPPLLFVSVPASAFPEPLSPVVPIAQSVFA